jgi:hypothetical protein
MKFNWGYKILIVYGLFVVGMMFLVYLSTQQKFELVQKDYYADELKYQNVIDASQKAKDLGGELLTVIKGGYLIVSLPNGFKNASVKGKAHLYYAADEKRDISKSFTTDNGVLNMELFRTMTGAYTLKLNVEMNGELYYYEQKVIF